MTYIMTSKVIGNTLCIRKISRRERERELLKISFKKIRDIGKDRYLDKNWAVKDTNSETVRQGEVGGIIARS